MANFVQLYKSTDQNMLPLFGAAGSGINLLKALLVSGLPSSIAISTITKSGTTATVTVSSANGLYFQTGQWVTISGATGGDGADYNGTFKITSTGATTFTYTMPGTPGSNAAGTLVASLLQPISTITHSGTLATVTLTNADPTLKTGHYVTITGETGNPSDYNGTFQITVTSTTTFTYTMPGTPGGSATGSPVYTRAPLGWSNPFSAGTNSLVFRSQDSSSNQFYLQVIDNGATAGGAKEMQIYGAEVMSADQTVTSGQFPTSAQLTNGLCARKSTTADSTTVRAWTLWGDDRTFYLCVNTGDANAYWNMGFGYFISFKSGDNYNTFIGANAVFNSTANTTYNGIGTCYALGSVNGAPSSLGFYVPRLYTQTGTAINGCLIAPMCTAGGTVTEVFGYGGSGIGTAPLVYPNPVDSGLYVAQPLVSDVAYGLRGRLPGIFYPLHTVPFQNYDQITGVTGLSGVTLTAVTTGGTYSTASSYEVGQFLIDTFGPWN